MSPALPLQKDETFLEEHRRIRQRLLRLSRFASAESGFPSPLSALVACMDEIEGLLPDLVGHFEREERALRVSDEDTDLPAEIRSRAEQVLSEHRPLLRELRVLWESGRRVISDMRKGEADASMAEALKAYLSACVSDLLAHEEHDGTFLADASSEKV